MCPFADFEKYQALLRDVASETAQALGTGPQAWRPPREPRTALPRPSASRAGAGRKRLLLSRSPVSGCKRTTEHVHRTDFVDDFVHCSENSAGPGDPGQRRHCLHPVPQVPGEQRYVAPSPTARQARCPASGRSWLSLRGL